MAIKDLLGSAKSKWKAFRAYKMSKKTQTLVTLSVCGMFGSFEVAIIIPTLWLYIQSRFGSQQKVWFGLIVSGYEMSAILLAPLVGRLCDMTGQTKKIILTLNFISLIGNVMYSFPISPLFLFIARIVAGVGSANGGAIGSTIVKATSPRERLRAFTILGTLGQLGVFLGPALNIFMLKWDFWIGPYHMDNLSGPGIFVACCIVLEMTLIYFGFHDDLPLGDQTDTGYAPLRDEDVGSEMLTRLSLISEFQDTRTYGTLEAILRNDPNEAKKDKIEVRSWKDLFREKLDPDDRRQWKYVWRELLEPENITVTFMGFALGFNNIAIAAIITLITNTYYDFQAVDNSYIMLAGTVYTGLISLAVYHVSKYIRDYALLLTGMILDTASLITYMCFYAQAVPHDWSTFPLFIVANVFDFTGGPIGADGGGSLFTKVTSVENQAFMSGLRTSIGNVALLLGPIWMSGTIHRPFVLFGVMLAMQALVWALVLPLSKKFWNPRPPSRPTL